MPDIDDDFLELTEPGAAQSGADSPGPLSAWSDLMSFAVFNGNFRLGPPDISANLDVASSVTGSNFVPGWRFVQSSNTGVTAKVMADTTTASGYNLTFTGVASSTGFIEQIVDIGGSAVRDIGTFLRVNARASVVKGTAYWRVHTQYLDRLGTITGMPPERIVQQTTPVANTVYSFDEGSEIDPPPAAARYLRIRISYTPDPYFDPQTLSILDVRRDRTPTVLRLPDRSAASGARSGLGLYDVLESGSNLLWQPSSTTAGVTTGKRLLNYQLVPIPFSLVNIPSNATTELQLWGDTALSLGTPRIGLPWGSAIVGCSYRLSAIPTAGGANALAIRIQVGGSTVWTPFTIAGSGGALSNEASQSVTADELTSGQQIGVVVDTSSTYAPTSADIAVLVWVAVKYDGA